MKTSRSAFNALHHSNNTPLLLANVWDVPSALAAQESGYSAIGTSSAALANTLGHADGEDMSFDEVLFMVKRIRAATQLPMSVDIEAGYSECPKRVAGHIKALTDIGVAGINLEDSRVTEGQRHLIPAKEFADFLGEIKSELAKNGIDMFINARTDTYLLGHKSARDETLKRASLYQAAGANGLFVPCLTALEDIKVIASSTQLPLNVMCMPELEEFSSLAQAGVKRISMGNFLFEQQKTSLAALLEKVKQEQTFASMF